MDPNANLTEQLKLAQEILNYRDFNGTGSVRLSELVLALDEWLRGGGFLPDQWEIARKRAADRQLPSPLLPTEHFS